MWLFAITCIVWFEAERRYRQPSTDAGARTSSRTTPVPSPLPSPKHGPAAKAFPIVQRSPRVDYGIYGRLYNIYTTIVVFLIHFV